MPNFLFHEILSSISLSIIVFAIALLQQKPDCHFIAGLLAFPNAAIDGSSYKISPESDKIYVSKNFARSHPAAFKMPKNRAWYPDVCRDLGHLIAMGVDAKILRDHVEVKGHDRQGTKGLKSLGLEHVALGFFVHMASLLLAIVVLRLEITYHRAVDRERKRAWKEKLLLNKFNKAEGALKGIL